MSGFLQTVRYAQKSSAHDDDIGGADKARQNDGCPGTHEADLGHHQEGGNHTAAEKHGKDDEEHQRLFEHQIFPGEHIADHDGKNYAQASAYNDIEQGVSITGEDIGILKDQLIAGNLKAFGVQQNTAMGCHIGWHTERCHDDIVERIQHENHQKDHQDCVADHKDPFTGSLFNTHNGFIPFQSTYHRLLSPSVSLRLTQLATIIIIKLMTELNRPTAAL